SRNSQVHSHARDKGWQNPTLSIPRNALVIPCHWLSWLPPPTRGAIIPLYADAELLGSRPEACCVYFVSFGDAEPRVTGHVSGIQEGVWHCALAGLKNA